MDRRGNVPHMFPDDELADLDELDTADGWLRATAPAGVAAYEGVKMWQGHPGPCRLVARTVTGGAGPQDRRRGSRWLKPSSS